MAAFLIFDIEMHDADIYDRYRVQVPPLVARHGGAYLVRGGDPENVEGTWVPSRIVVLRFPDRTSAKAFLDDPDYAPVKALRHAAATSDGILVDTVD